MNQKLIKIKQLGNSWCDELIPGPTNDILQKADDLLNLNHQPIRICPTIEEGVINL